MWQCCLIEYRFVAGGQEEAERVAREQTAAEEAEEATMFL